MKKCIRKINYRSPEKDFYNWEKCLRQVFIEEMMYLIDIISVLISKNSQWDQLRLDIADFSLLYSGRKLSWL